MKNNLLTIIAFLLIFNLSAQEEPSYKGWKFGINFSPEMGYRTLKIVGLENIPYVIAYNRDEREKPTLLSTSGLSAEYRLSKLISLRTGLHYSLRGFESKPETQSATVTPNGISSTTMGSFKYQYHYFGIPLNLQVYFLNKSKIQLFSSIGVGLDYLGFLSTRNRITNTNGENENELTLYSKDHYTFSDYPYLNVSIYASMGVDYRIGNKAILRLEPNYKRNITPTVYNAPIVEKTYNFGLNIGFIYSFR